MPTSLSAQLAQIAAGSKNTLDVKAQKAAHAKSLIFEPRVAASQNYQALYTICREGYDELCHLDARFAPFASTLFSEQSQNEDRSQMTAAEGAELDKKIKSFLRLVGGRLRLMPAIKAVEWLIRRFRYAPFCNADLTQPSLLLLNAPAGSTSTTPPPFCLLSYHTTPFLYL
jgi:U3 small nucleolar RNA-associated protein 10